MKNQTVLLVFVLAIFVLLTGCASTQKIEIVRVYDGDTFYVNIKSWPPIVGCNMPVRINGIDTPEIRGGTQKSKAIAKVAKKTLEKILYNAKVVELRNIKRGKYFRLLSDVYCDDKSVAVMLIKSGLAKPYNGGKRKK